MLIDKMVVSLARGDGYDPLVLACGPPLSLVGAIFFLLHHSLGGGGTLLARWR